MTKKRNTNAWILTFLSLSPIIWFVLFFLFHFIVLFPKAAQSEKVLQIELSYIVPPKEAQLIESGADHKTNQASAYNNYAIGLSPEKVFSYYDTELARHGWTVFYQRNSVVVGRTYCKDNYTASLSYYEKMYSWNYELWLSAGQLSECEMVKGGGIIFIPFSDLWFSLACFTSWLIYGAIIASASWRMKSKEFDQFIFTFAEYPIGIWRSRLGSFIIILVCLLGVLLSIYKIVMYLQNW